MVIVGICIIVISNIIVGVVVRKHAYRRMWHVASGSETSENVRYQGLETIRRQAKSDCTPTKLQLQPDYEEIGQRGK